MTACGRIGYETVSIASVDSGSADTHADAVVSGGLDAVADVPVASTDAADASHLADAGDALATDASGAAEVAPAPRPCIPFEGNWTLETPTPVDELNTAAGDLEPFLAADGVTMFFASARPNGMGNLDVYQAARAGPGAPFMNITPITGINSPRGDFGLRFTDDALIGFLSTTRDGPAVTTADIWIGVRASTTVPWNIGQFRKATELSTNQHDWDPFPSPDGLRVYYTIDQWPAGLGGKDNVMAVRDAVDEPFSAPTGIPGANSTFNDDNPALTPDERVLVFGSERPGGPGGRDLWYAVRATRDEPFSMPQLLPVVNTSGVEAEVTITAACELFFTSIRPGGRGDQDIYRTRFIPLP